MKVALTSIAFLVMVLVTMVRAATGQTFQPAPAAAPPPDGPAGWAPGASVPPSVNPAAPPGAGATPAPAPTGTPTPGGYPPVYGPPPGYPQPGYPATGGCPPAGGYPSAGYSPAYPPPPAYGQPAYGAPGALPYPYGGGYPYRNQQASAPGARTHDGGFLRMQIGLHGSTMTGKSGGENVQYSGGGASLGVAGGFALTPNFIIFGEAMLAGDSGADARLNGGGSFTTNLDTNLQGIGPGVAFYFGPNLFVSAAILIASASLQRSDGTTVVDSKRGAALDLVFGKEWWVSDNWGLGVSGQMLLAGMKGKDVDPTLLAVPDWTFTGFSLLFSATYN